MRRIRTADLYYGAYLMSKGSKLNGITLGGIRGKRVFFEFTGENLQKLALEYISGDATVNLGYLKSTVKHLKDIVFEKISDKTLV